MLASWQRPEYCSKNRNGLEETYTGLSYGRKTLNLTQMKRANPKVEIYAAVTYTKISFCTLYRDNSRWKLASKPCLLLLKTYLLKRESSHDQKCCWTIRVRTLDLAIEPGTEMALRNVPVITNITAKISHQNTSRVWASCLISKDNMVYCPWSWFLAKTANQNLSWKSSLCLNVEQ